MTVPGSHGSLGANLLSAVGYLFEVRVPVNVWLGLQDMLRQQIFYVSTKVLVMTQQKYAVSAKI